MSLPALKRITAAEIIRNFGFWQREAEAGPLEITRHGRSRTVMLSVRAFDALTAEDRPEPGSVAAKLVERQLAAILDNMDEGFVRLDAALAVRGMNKIAATFHGVLRDDMIGLPITLLWPSGRGELIVETCRRILRTGEVLHLDLTTGVAGRTASVRAFPYLDGVGLLFTNTTEHQRLREAADEWAGCAAALARNPATGWLRLDRTGRVLEAGAGALLASQIEPSPKKITLFEVVSPSDSSRVQQAFDDAIGSRCPTDLCVTINAGEGRRHDVRMSLTPLMRGPVPIGALAIFVMAPERTLALAGA